MKNEIIIGVVSALTASAVVGGLGFLFIVKESALKIDGLTTSIQALQSEVGAAGKKISRQQLVMARVHPNVDLNLLVSAQILDSLSTEELETVSEIVSREAFAMKSGDPDNAAIGARVEKALATSDPLVAMQLSDVKWEPIIAETQKAIKANDDRIISVKDALHAALAKSVLSQNLAVQVWEPIPGESSVNGYPQIKLESPSTAGSP